MKIRLSQLRQIIKEEVKDQTLRGAFKGRQYQSLSPELQADYDERSKSVSAGKRPSRSFTDTHLLPGTSWKTTVPFVVVIRGHADTDLEFIEPLQKSGIGGNTSRAIRKLPVGTVFTVVDNKYGVEDMPRDEGGETLLSLSMNYVLVEIEGKEYLIVSVPPRSVTPA